VHRRLALDQQSYGLVPGTPGRDVKGSAVSGDIEIAIALLVQSGDVDPEIEELANAVGIRRACELGNERAALGLKFLNERGFVFRYRTYGRAVVSGAGGDETRNAVQPDRGTAALDCVENVTPASASGDLDGRHSVGAGCQSRVCSVFEHCLD